MGFWWWLFVSYAFCGPSWNPSWDWWVAWPWGLSATPSSWSIHHYLVPTTPLLLLPSSSPASHSPPPTKYFSLSSLTSSLLWLYFFPPLLLSSLPSSHPSSPSSPPSSAVHSCYAIPHDWLSSFSVHSGTVSFWMPLPTSYALLVTKSTCCFLFLPERWLVHESSCYV